MIWDRHLRLLLGIVPWLWFGPTLAGTAEPTPKPRSRLEWRTRENLVTAHIQGWPLQKVLEIVAAKTHWRIYLEPGTEHVVSAEFRELRPGEALRRLLGGLSYALIPGADGASRLHVFRSSVDTATQLVTALDGAVDTDYGNEILVRLKPDAKKDIDQLAKALGASVVGRLDELRLYRLRFNRETEAQAALATLDTEADVEGTEQNAAFMRPEVAQAAASQSAPAFTLRPKSTADGSRIIVGLIDTAVQSEGTILKDFLLPGLSVAGTSSVPIDQLTHGSSMAETILYSLQKAGDGTQGTPVRILPVDVYGSGEGTSTYEIARGIYEAIEGGATVVNLSLGSSVSSNLLQDLIRSGREQGVTFVGAAGNEPTTTATYPAAYPEVIAVTASNRNGELAAYANYGDFVDMMAPGSSIVPFQGQPYVVVGTSTAAANVSGLAAALASNSGTRGTVLENRLRQTLSTRVISPKH